LSAVSRVDIRRLRDQLPKIVNAYNFGSMVSDTAEIKISEISKLGGGVSNNSYSFLLTQPEESGAKELALVLKVYLRNAYVKCRNEGHILKVLEQKNFPVPHLYIQEKNKFLGTPFLIMEKLEGKPIRYYLKKLKWKGKLNFLSRFAATLSFLHGLKLDDLGLDFLGPLTDEVDFARKQVTLLRDLKVVWNVKNNNDWIINWLEAEAPHYPCHQYSLLHGDMNLDNFLVNREGRLYTIDWEHPEIGDALKDVALAYHNIRLLFGGRNANEGYKLGRYFLERYSESSNRKIDTSTLRYYMVSTALLEAFSYRFKSAQALNPYFVKRILGTGYMPVFPLVWQHFWSKSNDLERFIIKELNSV
jgi:aminoglycoside phosphotransferase (APT) family kinase protein